MKNIILILVCIFLLVLDNSLIHSFAIYDVYPSLLFIFIVSYSILNGKKEGVKIGVISGLLQDIFFFQGFGINALINMLLCYSTAIVGEGIWKEKRVIPTITVFLISAIKVIGVYIIMYFFDININIVRGLYVALYNSILTFLLYGFLYIIHKKFDDKISWRIKNK